MDAFILWFNRENGWLDNASMGLADIPGQGRGAVALQDIHEGHTLFTISRSLTLSTHSSELPSLIGDATWKSLQLNKGWVGLILCMMWEESRGPESKWAGYFDILPRAFDTPMFWNEDELKELEGTDVPEKIGKDQAERDYLEKLIPAVQARQDLFNSSHLTTYYSLENYHLMGSRILSRSFQVEKWEGEDGAHGVLQAAGEAEVQEDQHAMDVDGETERDDGNEPALEDSDDEDEGDPSDVAMVPMADMLNARYGSDNAKLFHEPMQLRMVTTKPIKAGEQIYNTYGDLPNSDLLRRYGHIDLIPLPDEPSRLGNPADVVEIPADLVVEVISSNDKGVDDNTLKERIDWWLDEGGDDAFVIETDVELPDVLISFFKLLLLASPDWEKVRTKNKPPKPKLDLDSKLQILPIMIGILEKRLAKYPTTLEASTSIIRLISIRHSKAFDTSFPLYKISQHDGALLNDTQIPLPNNVRNAIVVRVGEKRILTGCAEKVRSLLEEAQATRRSSDRAEKKTGGEAVGQKKRKRGKEVDGDREDKSRRRSGR